MEQGQLSASDQNAIDLILCVCVLRLTQIIENGDIEINTWAGRFNLLGHARMQMQRSTAIRSFSVGSIRMDPPQPPAM